VGEAKLRQTADPRTGQFLRRLTQVRGSRVLVTTRLFPFELQAFNGEPLPGTFVLFMPGLADDDAVALWRSAGISGARDVLVPLFRSFEGHPLLVQALAGEIARDRRSPGDFEKWKQHHPDFHPFAMPLVQRKSHVLAYALQGLTPAELALLRAIAGFRMPAAYETLAALLVGEDQATRPFATDEAFDRALADLDDRGLVGWDRRANRYDLHPIVRGVVWNDAGEGDRQAIAERMRAHFEPMPTMEWQEVERLDDLTPAIELYVSLIRLERFDQAWQVFRDRLDAAMLWRLSASRQRGELLELLFPDGVEQSPRLQQAGDQSHALHAIGLAFHFAGRPGRAAPFFQRGSALHERQGDRLNLATILRNLSFAMRALGALHAAEAAAFRALLLTRAEADEFREGVSLQWIGMSRATRGFAGGDIALDRSLEIFRALSNKQGEGLVSGFLAQSALWRGNAFAARPLADRAWELAGVGQHERDFIGAARLQGEAALGLGDLDRADERLHHALTRARAVSLVEEELPALAALAALHHRRGNTMRAREHLDAVWDIAERGPYPLLDAEARNVLAEIEMSDKNQDAALKAATAAYRLAWCDGSPFAYDYGLRTARAHLRALGAPEPEMPPYDASKHEPIEEIPIEPEESDLRTRR